MKLLSSKKPYSFFYIGNQTRYSYLLWNTFSNSTNMRNNTNQNSNVTTQNDFEYTVILHNTKELCSMVYSSVQFVLYTRTIIPS